MSKREKELLTKIRTLEEERRVDQLELCNLRCQVETLMARLKDTNRVDPTRPPEDLWPDVEVIDLSRVEAAL